MADRLIAFSLFGHDSKYRLGMMHNLRVVHRFYAGWKVIVYCDRLNHDSLIRESLGTHAEIVLQQEESQGLEGAFWRFLATLRPGVQTLLFRDSDSHFTSREVHAVDEWLASPYDVHIIRDHPFHFSPVMAGTLGVRGRALKVLAEVVTERLAGHRLTEYGDDQLFLSTQFYPQFRSKTLVHTNHVRYFLEHTRPMPPDVPGEMFVGAYAFLTPEEQKRFLVARTAERPRTLAPPDWQQSRLLGRILQQIKPLQRIRHHSRWLL